MSNRVSVGKRNWCVYRLFLVDTGKRYRGMSIAHSVRELKSTMDTVLLVSAASALPPEWAMYKELVSVAMMTMNEKESNDLHRKMFSLMDCLIAGDVILAEHADMTLEIQLLSKVNQYIRNMLTPMKNRVSQSERRAFPPRYNGFLW